MCAALYGGLSAGLAATGLSVLLNFYWIQQGSMSFTESLAMSVFMLSCIMISGIAEAMQRAQTRARQLAAIVESSDDAIIGKTLDGKIASWNSGAERLYGYTKEEVIGRSSSFLLPTDNYDDSYMLLEKIAGGERVDHYETVRMKKDGTLIDVSLTMSPIKYANGRITGASVITRDITDRKKTEKLLQQLSTTDGLTGIANRRAFDDFLDEEWRRALRNEYQISIMMIDVDFFKKYNDTYGHLKGDECLKSVAAILKSAARRPGDMAARFGGEEFVAVLSMSDTKHAVSIAEKIRIEVEALKIPHEKSKISGYLTVSIGVVSVKPQLDMSPVELIKYADEALYKAKKEGRNRVVFKELLPV